MSDFKKMRDTFAKIVDICDELVILEEKESNGEDVEEELELTMGKYIIAIMKLQDISDSL